MKNTSTPKKDFPFPFILEELLPVRPVVKQVFGFTHIYLDERLLCSLRDSAKQPATNGMWLYTSVDHLESLSREFPQLSKRYLWRSGKNGWVVLASKLEYFEEYAYKACELILNGDRRIGRITRGSPTQLKQMKSRMVRGSSSIACGVVTSRSDSEDFLSLDECYSDQADS